MTDHRNGPNSSVFILAADFMPTRALDLTLLEALCPALHAPEQPGIRGNLALESGGFQQRRIERALLKHAQEVLLSGPQNEELTE